MNHSLISKLDFLHTYKVTPLKKKSHFFNKLRDEDSNNFLHLLSKKKGLFDRL